MPAITLDELWPLWVALVLIGVILLIWSIYLLDLFYIRRNVRLVGGRIIRVNLAEHDQWQPRHPIYQLIVERVYRVGIVDNFGDARILYYHSAFLFPGSLIEDRVSLLRRKFKKANKKK